MDGTSKKIGQTYIEIRPLYHYMPRTTFKEMRTRSGELIKDKRFVYYGGIKEVAVVPMSRRARSVFYALAENVKPELKLLPEKATLQDDLGHFLNIASKEKMYQLSGVLTEWHIWRHDIWRKAPREPHREYGLLIFPLIDKKATHITIKFPYILNGKRGELNFVFKRSLPSK